MRRALVFVTAVFVGCGGGGGDDPMVDAGPADAALPPMICKQPAAAAQPWFREVTSEIGLAKTATFEPLGTTVRAADLDGDNYPDVISTVGLDTRETTMRIRFVLMNRPDPANPGKRLLVD